MPLVCPKCQRTLLVRHDEHHVLKGDEPEKHLIVYCSGQTQMTPCDFEFKVTRED